MKVKVTAEGRIYYSGPNGDKTIPPELLGYPTDDLRYDEGSSQFIYDPIPKDRFPRQPISPSEIDPALHPEGLP
jgi:hypothetical protein